MSDGHCWVPGTHRMASGLFSVQVIGLLSLDPISFSLFHSVRLHFDSDKMFAGREKKLISPPLLSQSTMVSRVLVICIFALAKCTLAKIKDESKIKNVMLFGDSYTGKIWVCIRGEVT